MKKTVSLRRKLVLFIMGLLTGSLSFAIIGTYIYLAIEGAKFDAALSPEAYEAYYNADWREDSLPSQQILEEIAVAQAKYLDPSYQNEFWVFVLLSCLAVLFGGALAWRLSKQLTQPLETASVSAKIIADGDFSHQIDIPQSASKEIVSLGESFHYLTAALRKMEDNVRYTSASVAHELRTPLTVIHGYIQGIQDGVFKADQEQLDLILGQVSSLSRLIDDLKIISLAESRQLVLRCARTDLSECVEGAVDFMRPQFDQARRKISFQSAQGEAEISLDPERIKQAVIALINNSLRYGGLDGECVVRCVQEMGNNLVIVSDNGHGFSKEALERAGDRFWRGDRSRARQSGGSGLGLAVVKAIVGAHGGTLALANIPSGGAQVTLSLPGARNE